MEEKNYGVIEIAAAIAITGLIYMGNFMGPVIALISQEYPNIPTSTIKMLTTIPSLGMVLLAPLSGSLTSKYTIKQIVSVAALFTVAGQMIPVIIHSFSALLFSRFIFGIGNGMTFPMASAIINQLFTGAQKDKLMGIRAGCGALMGAGYSALAGYVGTIGWRNALACSLIGLVLVAFIFVKCPDNELSKPKTTDGKAVNEAKLTPMTYVLCLGLFLFNMFMVSFNIDLALVVTNDGLGSSAQAGTISSTFTVAAFVAGIIFGTTKKAVKRFISPLAFVLVGIAFLILTNAHSLPLFYVGAIFYGFGFGFYNPALTVVVAQSASKPIYAPSAISLYTSAVGIGGFLCPILMPRIGNIFGITGSRADWQIAMIGCFICTAVATIWILTHKNEA